MYIFENMGLLNQENKKDIIHLDYEVRVLSAINGTRAYYLIRETKQFVNDNIFRVLSDRDYAADCLGYIFSYWMENIHRDRVAVVYDLPKDDHSISFNLVQLNLSGRHTRLVSVIIDSKNKETFETLVEYLYYKEWDY